MNPSKSAFFILLILVLLYFRTVHWLGHAWLTDPFYSHGFLVVIVSAFRAWRALRAARAPLPDREPIPYHHGLYLFAGGLLIYAIGFITIFPFLMAVSLLFTLSGLILFFYGKGVMRALLFPVAYLSFVIPLPIVFLDRVAFVLQAISARYPAALLALLGIPVIRVGAEIQLANAAFTIGLPCSGMNSLIALLALAALFVYLLGCPVAKQITLFLLAVPLALLANILRITALLLIAHSYGAETATGFYHTLFSPLLFIIAFICLLGISKLIGCKLAL